MAKLKLRGSYTVEAACLSGLFLLVIFASLFLIIGTLHHSIRTNVSLEASELGSIQSVRKNQDGLSTANLRIHQETSGYSVSESNHEVLVSFEEQFRFPIFNLNWHIKGTSHSKVIQPVLFIEKIKKAQALCNVSGSNSQ